MPVPKCAKGRIGEAKTPGPKKTTAAQRASARAGLKIGTVELVGSKTVKLEKRLWDGFL